MRSILSAALILTLAGSAAYADSTDRIKISIENDTNSVLGAGTTEEEQGVVVSKTNGEIEPGETGEISFKVDDASGADASLKVNIPLMGKGGESQDLILIHFRFSGGKADCYYVISGKPGNIHVSIYDCTGPAIRYVIGTTG